MDRIIFSLIDNLFHVYVGLMFLTALFHEILLCTSSSSSFSLSPPSHNPSTCALVYLLVSCPAPPSQSLSSPHTPFPFPQVWTTAVLCIFWYLYFFRGILFSKNKNKRHLKTIACEARKYIQKKYTENERSEKETEREGGRWEKKRT